MTPKRQDETQLLLPILMSSISIYGISKTAEMITEIANGIINQFNIK